MPRFYINDGVKPALRCPQPEYRTKSGRQSDILNEAQAIARGRKNFVTPDPWVFRYWRIRADVPIFNPAAGNPDFWAISKLSMYENVGGGTDLAASAIPFASSEYSGIYAIANAFDANNSSAWCSSAFPGGDVTGEFIGVDLGVAKHVRRIDIRNYQVAGHYTVRNLTVQRSYDNVSWQDVIAVTGLDPSAAVINTITFN